MAIQYTDPGRGDVHLQVTKTKKRAMVLDRSYRWPKISIFKNVAMFDF